MSTLGLVIVLACFDPDNVLIYQFIAILDIASHWLQMYRFVAKLFCAFCVYMFVVVSSLLRGKGTHKGSTNSLLNIYYSNKVLFSGIIRACMLQLYPLSGLYR